MNKQKILFIIVALLLIGGAFFAVKIVKNYQQKTAIKQISNVPSPTKSLTSQSKMVVDKTEVVIPEELNLDVPFTPQAPTGNWDRQHEENCEEASMLMASRYFEGKSIPSASDAENMMAQIVDWENQNLGVSDSTTAEQTARTLREFFNLKTTLITNPSIEQMKKAIVENNLIVVPASGRELQNPFYTPPGPVYHMILIKGYTKNQFVTNDPGTKRGQNYPYDFNILLKANHDWNSGEVSNGKRIMIFVSK